MRGSIMMSLLSAVVFSLVAGCATTSPQNLVQSALADTHLGWRPAGENELAFSVATASGIARVELRPLPLDVRVLTLDLPGMRRVEGVQWQGRDGEGSMLYGGGDGADGVSVRSYGHGFRLRIQGPALDLVRGGGQLTVIDYYRG